MRITMMQDASVQVRSVTDVSTRFAEAFSSGDLDGMLRAEYPLPEDGARSC